MVQTFNPEVTPQEETTLPSEAKTNSEIIRQAYEHAAEFPPTPERKKVVEDVVENVAKNPKYQWNGQTASAMFIDTYKYVKRITTREKKQELGIGEKEQVQIPDQELIEATTRQLCKAWGERIATYLPVGSAETIHAAKNAIPSEYVEGTSIEDITKQFGSLQKDYILMTYYFTQLEQGGYLTKAMKSIEPVDFNWSDKEVVEQEMAKMRGIIEDLEGITMANRTLNEWRQEDIKSRFRGNPGPQELFEWTLRRNADKYGERGVEFARNAWEAAQALIDHETNGDMIEKIATGDQTQLQEILERISISIYEEVNIPDAILAKKSTMEDGHELVTCDGIVKSFVSYTPEQVKQWTANLQTYRQESLAYGLATPYSENPQDLNSRFRTLGFNPENEFKAVNLATGMGVSELAFKPDGGYAMILRFSNEIPEEDLQNLGSAIERAGYTNFIIQRIPFNQTEIKDIARYTMKRRLGLLGKPTPADIEAAEKRFINDEHVTNHDYKVLAQMARQEVWE